MLCRVTLLRRPLPCSLSPGISKEPSGSGIELENLGLDHLVSYQESKASYILNFKSLPIVLLTIAQHIVTILR